MKNTAILFITGIMILVVGGFVFINGQNASSNVSNTGQVIQGEVQKVLISEKGLNYYPSEIRVKANSPVEITLDDRVKGCLRSFTIRDLGISKYAKTSEDKIVFTPMEKGTFTFACSMGMGYGKLVVE